MAKSETERFVTILVDCLAKLEALRLALRHRQSHSEPEGALLLEADTAVNRCLDDIWLLYLSLLPDDHPTNLDSGWRIKA